MKSELGNNPKDHRTDSDYMAKFMNDSPCFNKSFVGPPMDHSREIKRLSELSIPDYEQSLEDSAKRLNIGRIEDLDKLVMEARKEIELEFGSDETVLNND